MASIEKAYCYNRNVRLCLGCLALLRYGETLEVEIDAVMYIHAGREYRLFIRYK